MIENENQGNAIVRQMIMDGLIIRLAGGVKTLPNEAIADARNLINALKTKNVGQHSSAETDTHINGRIKYVHPKCAINFDLAILSEELCTERLLVTTLLEKVTPNELISAELQYILRALLLIEDDNFLSADEWRRIWKCLLKIAKRYGDASTDLMYFLLYHIAKEVDGEKQLELLRAMTTFATVKVSLIVNTISLDENNLSVFCFFRFTGKHPINSQYLSCTVNIFGRTENVIIRFIHTSLDCRITNVSISLRYSDCCSRFIAGHKR